MTRQPETRPLGPRNSHYWKLQQMLRVVGADAAAAFDDGELSSEEWAGMVETCRGCDWVAGCSRYMARQRLEGAQDEAPETCPNADILSSLRKSYPEVA